MGRMPKPRELSANHRLLTMEKCFDSFVAIIRLLLISEQMKLPALRCIFTKPSNSKVLPLLVFLAALLPLRADLILEANFNGAGTGTGGVADIVNLGGTGALVAYTSSIVVPAAAPGMGQGNFLHLDVNGDGVTSPSNGLAGGVDITPASDANSFKAMNTVSGGSVTLHGAFDFFLRNDNIAGNLGQIIDCGTAAGGGIRVIVQQNNSSNSIRFRLYSYTGSAGGEGFLTGAGFATPNQNAIIDAPFTPAEGTIYHLAFTMSTDSGTGISTMNLYMRADAQAISTASSADRIGTFEFKIKGPNITAGMPSGKFLFGFGGTVNPATPDREVSVDVLRLYDSMPAEFPALPGA